MVGVPTAARLLPQCTFRWGQLPPQNLRRGPNNSPDSLLDTVYSQIDTTAADSVTRLSRPTSLEFRSMSQRSRRTSVESR